MAAQSYDDPGWMIGTAEESDRSRTTFASGTAPDRSSTSDQCTLAAVKLGSVVAVVSVVIAYAVFHLHGGTSQMDEIPRTCASAVSGFQMQLTLAEKNNQAARSIIASLEEELANVKEQLKTTESVGCLQMQMTLFEKYNQAAGNKMRSLLEELVIIKDELKSAESAYINELKHRDEAYLSETLNGEDLMIQLTKSDIRRKEAEADVQSLNEQIDKLRKELNQHQTTN